MHHTYLPFSAEQLAKHFAPVKNGTVNNRHLNYYSKSIKAWDDLANKPNPLPKDIARGRQMEKDERFWVASALMGLMYGTQPPGGAELFSQLLQRAGLKPPDGLDSWKAALTGELHLFFEVSLPAPKSYKKWLAEHYGERTVIPYAKEAATHHPSRLEGTTKADAVLLCEQTGTAVIFEAKVLSDISTKVQYDVMRNQLARLIDVSLEPAHGVAPLHTRRPRRTYVVLLTPEILSPRKQTRGDSTRLYGWLMRNYGDPEGTLLAKHLSHRRQGELEGAAVRLGWTTWEDCNTVLPGACPWLVEAHVDRQ